ncbi:MAG: hypothetical protein ABSE82_13415 [Nitrososphaerales archaeon]|jgi:hypothetical protein
MVEAKRPSSIHVNFRIDAAYKGILEEGARRRDIHLNAYVNHILGKFIFLDGIVEESQHMVLRKEIFARIVALGSAEDLVVVAGDIGRDFLKSALAFASVEANMDDLVRRYFLPMGIYSGWYRSKVVKTPSGNKLILQHDFGPKWTAFLKEYCAVVIKSLIHDEVSIVAHDGILEIRYR